MKRAFSTILAAATLSLACDADEPKPLPACVEHIACLSECTAAEGGPSSEAVIRCNDRCPPGFGDGVATHEAFLGGISALSVAESYICGGTSDHCDAWIADQTPKVIDLFQQTALCLREVQNK